MKFPMPENTPSEPPRARSDYAFPLVEVAGSARSVGRAHGDQARPLVARYLDGIETAARVDRNTLGRKACWFLPLLEHFSHACMEEANVRREVMGSRDLPDGCRSMINDWQGRTRRGGAAS